MNPPSTIAHYRIVSKLGEGGMGAVYRATDTKLNRDVAIKVLPDALANDSEYLARFTREAQVLAALNHPNIAAIYGVEDRAIVMELVEGRELPAPLPIEEALPIARQIAEALEAAHDRGIVHRDLKPANIKLTADGAVKVLDFGLAKAADSPGQSNASLSPTLTLRATQAGVILGTAAYMAPEQAAGKPVDKRADIWAFGVVLYELLTGRQLFHGETVSHILASVLKDPISLDGIPEPLRPLLARCLDRDPRTRLRDIGEARVLLSRPLPAAPRPVVSGRGSRWWMAACAVLALALAGGAVLRLRETPRPPATRFQIFPSPAFGLMTGALSPDGRKIVYQSTGNGYGRPVIWVRSFDSIDAVPLPGTEGASSPFWSPDSRSVGFWSNNKLLRVEVSGGPVRLICDTGRLSGSGGVAGSWSTDGMIYFSAAGQGIFRAPQSGGAPFHLTTPDRDRGEGAHFFPIALPDGKGLLFHNQTRIRDDSSIDFIPLDGKHRSRLAASLYSFDYAPPLRRSDPGHLIYLRQNTLMAQPLDPDAMAPSGEAFPIADRVATTGNTARFAVSPAGVLAYRPIDAAAVRELTWFDRDGRLLSTVGTPADFQDIELSRDAGRIAAVQLDGMANRRDIWLLETARGVAMRFSFDQRENDLPQWSPDGSRILFSSRDAGPYSFHVKSPTGAGGEEPLANSPDGFATDWSDDGRHVLFARRSRGSYQLWFITDPGDSAREKVHPFLDTQYATVRGKFAPAAGGPPRWVAYESDESGRGPEIYVQSFPAGGAKFLISKNGGAQPRWRRDGRELYFLTPDGKLMAVDVQAGATFQAGIPRPLFDAGTLRAPSSSTGNSYRYDVSPDGKRFLFNVARPADSSAPPPSIVVVMNWLSGVKK